MALLTTEGQLVIIKILASASNLSLSSSLLMKAKKFSHSRFRIARSASPTSLMLIAKRAALSKIGVVMRWQESLPWTSRIALLQSGQLTLSRNTNIMHPEQKELCEQGIRKHEEAASRQMQQVWSSVSIGTMTISLVQLQI
jgi:hypothetical protein